MQLNYTYNQITEKKNKVKVNPPKNISYCFKKFYDFGLGHLHSYIGVDLAYGALIDIPAWV